MDIVTGVGITALGVATYLGVRSRFFDEFSRMEEVVGEGRRVVARPLHQRTQARATFGTRVIEPVGYHDSLCLTENARLILTDSGGLQEESTYFRKPCLTLRPNTERPITITVGSNRLTDLHRLSTDLEQVVGGNGRAGSIPPKLGF